MRNAKLISFFITILLVAFTIAKPSIAAGVVALISVLINGYVDWAAMENLVDLLHRNNLHYDGEKLMLDKVHALDCFDVSDILNQKRARQARKEK